jgi:hypothetical protein
MFLILGLCFSLSLNGTSGCFCLLCRRSWRPFDGSSPCRSYYYSSNWSEGRPCTEDGILRFLDIGFLHTYTGRIPCLPCASQSFLFTLVLQGIVFGVSLLLLFLLRRTMRCNAGFAANGSEDGRERGPEIGGRRPK